MRYLVTVGVWLECEAEELAVEIVREAILKIPDVRLNLLDSEAESDDD